MGELVFVAKMADLELPAHAVVIADRALPAALLNALPAPILVDAGESIKTLAAVGQLAEQVLARRSTRPMTLVAIGGGSLGDAAGFLASILWRGVPIWHVPTTLVAMVDSAHGGKTAVNLGAAKNQLGTFHEAERVVLVDEALETLPLPQRREGLAELIKALWLGDAPALDALEQVGVGALASAPMSEVGSALRALIARAVAVKHAVVARDPHETLGLRTWLNFGHTAAHVLELELGTAHGHAVAWGMAAASELLRAWPAVPPAHAERLWSHLWPLLTPLDLKALDAQRFEVIILRDKKRVDGKLRSVLVSGPGAPFVTTEVSAAQWFDALQRAARRLAQTPLRAQLTQPRAVTLRMEASKSEMNRAQLIAALRPGTTHLDGTSQARDVLDMRGALAQWRNTPTDAPLVVHAGLGGTTLRFLLAACLTRRAPTTLLAAPRLLARPHDALLRAMQALGAAIEPVEGGLHITPGPHFDGAAVCVRCDVSSQYASALAMLSASGIGLTLVLRTDDTGFDPEHAASLTYLDMTLAMLTQAGVRVTRPAPDTIVLAPTEALFAPCTLVAAPDESSAAMWRCLAALGHPVTLDHAPTASLQADAALPHILARLTAASAEQLVEVSLRTSPDLAPVLAATAALLPCGLRVVDAAHLKHKESDRIAQLIAALGAADIVITPRTDGFEVAPGVQHPTPGAHIPTFGDHRLAMAALVLSSAVPLIIDDPWVVTKSYPACWHDAAAAGWSIQLAP